MEVHDDFTKWVVDKGVLLNGVASHRFPGRGMGVITTRAHKIDSVLINVPIACLITRGTVPKAISSALPSSITVHGLLAATLSLSSAPTPWTAVLPSPSELNSSIPLTWDPALQALLPHTAAELLAAQKAKIAKDWDQVSAAFPQLKYDDYLYNWLLLNTRTFYYLATSKRKGRKPPRDDCLALNPFADYINHSSTPCCYATYSSTHYTIMAAENVPKGTELSISYGPHSNDYLLAEYGFILPTIPSPSANTMDSISLDPYILPLLSADLSNLLSSHNFLSSYHILSSPSTHPTICHRTEVALRALFLTPGRLARFVSGADPGIDSQDKANALLLKILFDYKTNVDATVKEVDALNVGLQSQREMLKERYVQMSLLLETFISQIQR